MVNMAGPIDPANETFLKKGEKDMTNNPIEIAKASTPWWMIKIRAFDGLEIHPCQIVGRDPDGTLYWEQCNDEEAEVWSVYGHLLEGGIDCLEDYQTYAEAKTFAEELLKVYPHLQKFGL